MIATVRLQLRPFAPGDDLEAVLLPALREGFYSRQLAGRPGEPLAVATSQEALALIEACRIRGGEILAVVVAVGAEAGIVAGHCGIFPGATAADRSIAFELLPAFRGRGYAEETCAALVDAAFAVPGVAAVSASAAEDAWPTRRALEDTGFRLLEVTAGPDGDRAHYRLSWLDRR